MPHYEDLTYEVKGRVALLTLDRPDKLNAWTAAMEKSLKQALAAAVADDNVRVIVVTGAGRGFCAGADMGLLQSIKADNWEERELAQAAREEEVDFASGLGPDVSPHYGGRFGYLMQVKKPIIAAINGPAAGLGLVVALYADMRFAGSDAKFTTAFAQRGLIAEHGISWLLPRLVGPAHALDLLLSARKVTADEAERMGLVNKVFEQVNFMGAVMDYARALAETVSPRSMGVMKAQVWKSLFQDFNEALAVGDSEMQKSFATADFKEGVAHFVEKRKANFTGR
ncbi:enoyl-CoA hydratase [Parvibaculum sedimenti]|uniref:Enoyl-CoA hydratase n=1 Tax=Parvibaculum sedimenti TaxID=2608632 RepID=A0A6N6VGG6_9HYPH|nr:enoyl-CoA hydratase [Parvibaculum sedimenti]KAB7739983.1 enoyl-CoA hydratase [Parvibaculum sedimenti]